MYAIRVRLAGRPGNEANAALDQWMHSNSSRTSRRAERNIVSICMLAVASNRMAGDRSLCL